MSNVLTIREVLREDNKAIEISNYFITWSSLKQPWVDEKKEIAQYVFATDTTKTSNSKLPWSNKTTIPKLAQIRDNLIANYMMAMFPKRKWLAWEAADPEANQAEKIKTIESYMAWVVDRNEFYDEVQKLVCDYIDYGNCFSTVEWVDRRNFTDEKTQVGYVGPMVRRISPLDIVLNPTAVDFSTSPKIIRSLVSLGEVKELIARESLELHQREDAEDLYRYMKELREQVATLPAENSDMKDDIYQVSGFGSFKDYLDSNTVEILTFYGDIYDEEKDEFLRNQVIRVVDRHKVLSQRVNTTLFGAAPIYHCGWRIRPDSIWAMGPLDNLVGMQYRIDHLENIKADVFDLFAYPPLEIKGYVEDFQWAPFEKIFVGDDSSVKPLAPEVQALQANTEIAILEMKMEEMAGSPKEAMGFRTPGEKTKYEVQRLENAASRIYQNRINHFERQQTENLLNAMLELSRRLLDSTTIRVFDSELKVATFKTLTAEDITGNGQIKPIAARHFAEQAQQIQDITTWYSSAAGQDPELRVHFSSIRMAKLYEDLLDLEAYKIFQPFIRLSETADAQRLMNSHQEQVAMDTMTPSGMNGDFDMEALNAASGGMDVPPQGPAGQGQPGAGAQVPL